MVDRRSPGAESLAVFEQTLDRLLVGSGYGPDVQDRVVEAVRGGASTIRQIAEETGLATAIVERAVDVLLANGRLAPKAKRPRPVRSKKAVPAPPPDEHVASTG